MKRWMSLMTLAGLCATFDAAAWLTATRDAGAAEKRPVTLDDLDDLREVGDPQIAPDGAWVAYTVSTTDRAADRTDSDLWMTSWDGARTLRLTYGKEQEHAPRFSPDGRFLAFLSSRGYEEGTDQVWLMDRAGGEAERITDLKGGVTDLVWSPDGRRLALVAEDAEPDAAPAGREDAGNPPPRPIVIDRFQFKLDQTGYLGRLRSHLYLLDPATRKPEILTPGPYDEYLPSWSPDGASLAFVTKRGQDFDRNDNWDIYVVGTRPGAAPRRLTVNDLDDCDPEWDSRPAWSPDGASIAYPQGGPQKMIYYSVYQLAVIPAAGGTPRLLAPDLDRLVTQPRWSADGKAIYALVEEDRNVELARFPISGGGKVDRIVAGRRLVSGFDLGPDGKVAVLSSTPNEPFEVAALDGVALRPLTRQNQELISRLRLATTEEFSARSKDGTSVSALLVKPPDYKPGTRYPALLRLHGGPVWQSYNEFRSDWQLFAARGYVVIGPNPRGGSGRGEAYARAIYADWGNKDTQDVLATVDYAVAQGITDPERLGIGGHSYGSMLTNYTIAQDTRFKAAVSGAGSSNALAEYGTDQYIREYEQELGVPWRNLDAYLKVSYPFLHADRIVTPTLFYCGDKDFNMPLLNSEQMYQALRSLGRDTQLIIYPGEYHSLTRPSFIRDELERSLAWYDRHLLTRPAATAGTP
jgi:dipeptidyl aminopeptidase/acylaminoacyl peptidase